MEEREWTDECFEESGKLPLGDIQSQLCKRHFKVFKFPFLNETKILARNGTEIVEFCMGTLIFNYWPFNRFLFCWMSPILKYYRTFIYPIITILGIFGNIMAFKIFLKRTEIKGTCRIYYFWLAVADLVYLISFAIPEWTSDGLNHLTNGAVQFWPDRLSNVSCKLFRFFMHSSWFMSNWIMVIYSIERVLAISYPFLRTSLIKPSVAKKICFVIIIFTILMFSLIFYTSAYVLLRPDHPNFSYRECFVDYDKLSWIGYIWFLSMAGIFTMFLPPILVMIINSILLKKLKELSENRSHLTNQRNDRSSAEVKNAKTLLLLAGLMLIFTLPTLSWAAYVYIDNEVGMQIANELFIYTILNYLYL